MAEEVGEHGSEEILEEVFLDTPMEGAPLTNSNNSLINNVLDNLVSCDKYVQCIKSISFNLCSSSFVCRLCKQLRILSLLPECLFGKKFFHAQFHFIRYELKIDTKNIPVFLFIAFEVKLLIAFFDCRLYIYL